MMRESSTATAPRSVFVRMSLPPVVLANVGLDLKARLGASGGGALNPEPLLRVLQEIKHTALVASVGNAEKWEAALDCVALKATLLHEPPQCAFSLAGEGIEKVMDAMLDVVKGSLGNLAQTLDVQWANIYLECLAASAHLGNDERRVATICRRLGTLMWTVGTLLARTLNGRFVHVAGPLLLATQNFDGGLGDDVPLTRAWLDRARALPLPPLPQGPSTLPQVRSTGPQVRSTGPQGKGTGPQGKGTGPQGKGTGPQGKGTGPQVGGTGPQGKGMAWLHRALWSGQPPADRVAYAVVLLIFARQKARLPETLARRDAHRVAFLVDSLKAMPGRHKIGARDREVFERVLFKHAYNPQHPVRGFLERHFIDDADAADALKADVLNFSRGVHALVASTKRCYGRSVYLPLLSSPLLACSETP